MLDRRAGLEASLVAPFAAGRATTELTSPGRCGADNLDASKEPGANSKKDGASRPFIQ